MSSENSRHGSQAFEEVVASWSDAMSFAPASALINHAEQGPWRLGEKDSSSSLVQTLATLWDEEIARSTEKSVSSSSATGIRSTRPESNSFEDPVNAPYAEDDETMLLGADSERSDGSRVVESSSPLSRRHGHDASLATCPSLWHTMWRFLGRDYVLGGFLTVLQNLCLLLPLFVLPVLLSYLQNGASQVSELKALVVSGTIGLSFAAFAFFRTQKSFVTGRLSLHFASALRGLVFSKSLRLKFKAWDSRIPSRIGREHAAVASQEANKKKEAGGDFDGRDASSDAKTTSHIAHAVLTSVPAAEQYLLRCHELWTTPIILCACIIYLWSFVQLSALAGLFVFAATLAVLHGALLPKIARDEAKHSNTIYHRNMQLEDMLTNFVTMKEMCAENYFENQLKHSELAAPAPSLLFWSVSFILSNTSFVIASLWTIFFRAIITGVRITVIDLVLVHLLFLFIQTFMSPYVSILRHSMRMRDFMDVSRMLLLEEEVESFENENVILSLARYAILTKYYKINADLPRARNSSDAHDREEDLPGQFGGFYDPSADAARSPSPAMLLRSINSSGASSSDLAQNMMPEHSISSPMRKGRKPRAYAPVGKVISVPEAHHIQLAQASFIWDDRGVGQSLRDITLKVRSGQFIAVLGATASGKSSLLKALLGEMTLSHGTAKVGGTMSYAPQVPWTLTESICFNITFTQSPPRTEHYKNVLDVSGVALELEPLEDGDETMLSDANFTPAQIARISLARALYRSADIYMFDNTFGSFESEKKADEALDRTLATCKNSTRIVALAHYAPAIERADLILYMKDGAVVHSGSYHQLIDANGPDFFDALRLETEARNLIVAPQQSSISSFSSEYREPIDPNESLGELLGIARIRLNGFGFDSYTTKIRHALRYYARRIGVSATVVITIALVASLFLDLASNIRFAYWLQTENRLSALATDKPANQVRLDQLAAVSIWTTLIGLSLGFFGALFWLFCSGAAKAAHKLWFSLIDTILRWPVTAMLHGRRRSSHLAQLLIFETFRFQGLLPRQWHRTLSLLFVITSCIVSAAAGSPFSIPFLLLAVYFLWSSSKRVFPAQSRLSHLTSASTCLLESCYSSVLQGAVTVRVYEAEHRFTQTFFMRQDEVNAAKLSQQLLHSHTHLRLGLFAAIIPASVCLLGVLCKMAFGFVSAANLGIAFFWAMHLAFFFPQISGQTYRLLELLHSLYNLRAVLNHSPREDGRESKTNDPRFSWPSNGTIEFSHVTVAKRGLAEEVRDEEGDINRSKCALWDVSFKINGKTTAAFCGPRGSGKSSILRALMRFDAPDKNGASMLGSDPVKMAIDDVEISQLGLHTLRGSISLITSSVLSMTVRDYLSSKNDDSAKWKALEEVGLRDKVSFMDAKLDSLINVESRDCIFDATERILLNMARARVLNTSIVIFKEPRLPVNTKLISNLLNTLFAHKTTLIIIARSFIYAEGADTTYSLHHGSFVQSLI